MTRNQKIALVLVALSTLLGCCVVGAAVVMFSAGDAKDERVSVEERKATPTKLSACADRTPATSEHLGLRPHFVECLEGLLASMKLPSEARPPFIKESNSADGTSTLTIKDYITISYKQTNGFVQSMDVFFFPKFRNQGGVKPVLLAQALTLAVVFPSGKNDPAAGSELWKEIDAIGRKTNNSQIAIERDDIQLNASFLPISVRYQFKPSAP